VDFFAVIRKSVIAYSSTVTVAPVTFTIRGVPSEVVLNEEDDGEPAQCSNGVATATGETVAQLSSARMNEVCAALRFSLGALETELL
jgi:mRNA-degrading endonuclease toxin of MazEF toxin-antitoxin module